MAFHGLNNKAAQGVLIRHFGSVMAGVSANPVASMADEGHIVRYINDFSALIATSRGKQVVTSTAPFLVSDQSGGKVPVDLDLLPNRGRFVPVTPLAPVSIAQESHGGVTVGSGGLRITLRGDNQQGTIINGQDVFFGNVGPDMDATAAPKIHGADLSVILRSRLSPEHFRYQVTLPVGASLRAARNGAIVSLGGLTVARIPAPSAQDAQGTVVPVQMSVLRNSLVLSVPHRSHDFSYPILVDPEITINILESSEGWVFGQTISGPYGPVFTPGPFVPGSPGSLTLPSTEFSYGEGEDTVEGGLAHWDAWPRPSADISSVEFVGISTSYSYSSHEYEESGESVNVSACKEVRSAGPFRAGEETLPSKVRFVPLLHDPGSCKEEDISVEMEANGPIEHELWLKEEGKRGEGEKPV